MNLSLERFLRLRAGEIQTRSIKGTLPRLADTDADRQQAARRAASAKDQAENLMIVDLLSNDIGRVAQPGSLRVPSLFAIETFTVVHHMVSTITATLATDHTPCYLPRACLPGGSITGATKVPRAMEIIEMLEPQRRSAWCGSIGYVSCCGAMNINITIHTLLLADQHIHCPVGGGLIADSDKEVEYQETLAKAASLLPLPETLHVTYHRRRAAVLIPIICHSTPILLLTRRGFQVTPIVGLLAPDARFVASEAEVAEIFKIPLTEALSLASYTPLNIERRAQIRRVYFSWYRQYMVWGMTAQILYRLGQHIRPPIE